MRSYFVLLAFLLFAQSANAEDAADAWGSQDKALEAIYQTALIADWNQTRQMAKNPKYYEAIAGGIIGAHPSVAKVNQYFIATSLIHLAVVNFLPAKYRTIYQSAGIVLEVVCIYQNYSIGLNVSF